MVLFFCELLVLVLTDNYNLCCCLEENVNMNTNQVRARSRGRIYNLVLSGLFAAITAVLTLITIPMPSGVPITLQTFAVALAGYSLGFARGTISTVVYVALGAVGLPVFAGMQGGVGVIAGPTGGFIFGFILLTACCGGAVRLADMIYRNNRKAATQSILTAIIALVLGIIGLAVCHVLGSLQYAFISNRNFGEAFMLVSLPYIVKDIVSVVGAYFVGWQIRARVIK